MLKDLIKKLSAEQVELKKARKTGKYEFIGNAWGDGWNYDCPQFKKMQSSWKAASDVRVNSLKITAALNLYHEVRGSDYRHNVKVHDKWTYDKMLLELRAIHDTFQVKMSL